MHTAGQKLRDAIQAESPLAIVGAINAFAALLAQQVGFKALYLSGAGVANASYGLPDLGVTNLSDVVIDIQRITYASELPLLVDADTGWGNNKVSITRTVKTIARAGAAGLHIEDQTEDKRCGHRPGKHIVSTDKMIDRIKAAVDGREDASFVIMARTDALANEGLDAALERASHYVAAGADMLFPEAVQTLEHYHAFSQATQVPILANITEFGKTPLFTQTELAQAGVSMALYPLSAFRAMNKAALTIYQTIKTQGTQQPAVAEMQTREELYAILNYYADEEKTNG